MEIIKSPTVNADDKIETSESSSDNSCHCIKNTDDRMALLVISTCMLHFMSIGVVVVPLKLLINQRIAGDANDPNSASVFVDTTNIFLYAFMSFICGRYTSGLGDFIGRKPVMGVSIVVLILTRAIYINSERDIGFYVGAIIGGTFDCFYYSGLAWVCDIYPDQERRSQRVGFYSAFVLGLSLTISAPVGAVLAGSISLHAPFIVSPIISLISLVMLVCIPVDDTIAAQHGEKLRLSENGADTSVAVMHVFGSTSHRTLPADTFLYLTTHFPLSVGSLNIIKLARSPQDWLTHGAMQCIPALFALILVQYCLAVFHWSPTVSSLAVFSVGLCLGLTSPPLLHFFPPLPVALYAMCLFTSGLVLLAIAGSGIQQGPAIGAVGIACVALGTSWIPSLQTNLASQYEPSMQGMVGGLLSQQKDFAVLPAYLMSLGFTFSLERPNGFYWPGCSMAMAACLGLLSICIHYRTHKEAAVCRQCGVAVSMDPTADTLDCIVDELKADV